MKLTKEPVRKALLNLEKLKNHRLDVVALSEVTGRLLLRKNRFADCIVQAPYVYQAENKVYMVLSETSRFAPRLKEFNAVMRELTEAGRREQIKIRYLEYLQ
jgi:ABC-type amino acid transport substrate-binding protein